MEYVEGGSRADRLSDKPWENRDAAELIEKLARAIHKAHEKKIVHRDLKLENVLLTEAGEPKITDFGLAKRMEADGKTQTGAVMGTPAYMAPEQAAGKKDIGPAADIHALGGILFRLLAGRPPFEGGTTLDVLMRVLGEGAIPLRKVNPRVDRDLETIVQKCLRKSPAERYTSSADLADDLRRYLDGEPIRARKESHFQRAYRFTMKNSDQAMLRLVIGFSLLLLSVTTIINLGFAGIGYVSVGGLMAIAAFRGTPRTLLWGSLGGLPVTAILALSAYFFIIYGNGATTIYLKIYCSFSGLLPFR